ncbi:MAG TPA: hypothetical protein VF690_16765 [Hymenobacter sp.]|jgi:hypothetical protein
MKKIPLILCLNLLLVSLAFGVLKRNGVLPFAGWNMWAVASPLWGAWLLAWTLILGRAAGQLFSRVVGVLGRRS